MSDIEVAKLILGKTIKGVVAKYNTEPSSPYASIFLVFSDDTAFEIYSNSSMNFAKGLWGGGMEFVRSYISGRNGPMVNSVDVSLDEE
jgi:hypothetical protein